MIFSLMLKSAEQNNTLEVVQMQMIPRNLKLTFFLEINRSFFVSGMLTFITGLGIEANNLYG